MKSALLFKREEYLALLMASASLISYLAIWFRT